MDRSLASSELQLNLRKNIAMSENRPLCGRGKDKRRRSVEKKEASIKMYPGTSWIPGGRGK